MGKEFSIRTHFRFLTRGEGDVLPHIVFNQEIEAVVDRQVVVSNWPAQFSARVSAQVSY